MKTPRANAPRAKVLALAVASCFVSAYAPLLLANPQAPQVVAGQAAFQQLGTTLNVTNKPGTIINWQSFNIDRGELTRFIQQNAASQVLNRVTGSADPSRILGSLQSNGRVLLINPNGVVFGQGSQVDVAGLLVSSLSLSNEDFLAGKLKFTDTPGAGIVKTEGNIKTASGGSVVLIAPRVENSGIIQTPEGTILLAAGRAVEIVDLEHRDIRVEVTNREQQAINLGTLLAKQVNLVGGLVRNSGTIQATTAVVGDNGKIMLKGRYAAENTGTLQASGPQGGDILVQATEGKTSVEGIVEARGKLPPPPSPAAAKPAPAAIASGHGGRVEILGQEVAVDQVNIDVSGDTGGGAVLIGGDYQGGQNPLPAAWAGNTATQRLSLGQQTRFIGSPSISESPLPAPAPSDSQSSANTQKQPLIPNRPPLQTARNTVIGPNARIRSDATRNGDGGVIVVWSEKRSSVSGEISARGAGTGHGGLVETSSHGVLAVKTTPSIGVGGLWLLDPYDITVVDNDSDGVSSLTPSDSNSTIAASLIVSALNAGSNVTLDTTGDNLGSATGNISVDAAIAKSAGSNAVLTLNAHNDIKLNADIGSTVGQLNLVLNPDSDLNATGAVYLGNTTLSLNGGLINAAGKTVKVTSGTATLNSEFSFGQLRIAGGTLNLATGSSISLSGPLSVVDGTLDASDDLSVAHLNWEGGTITGNGKLITPATGTAMLSSGSTKYLQNKTWDNAGSITIADGTLQLDGHGSSTQTAPAAILNNQAGASIQVSSSAYYPIYGNNDFSAPATLDNAGTIDWNSSYSTYGYASIYNTLLNNSGTVLIKQGLRLENSSGNSSGNYQIAAGQTLSLYGSNINLGAVNISGSGAIDIQNGATLSLNGNLSLAASISLSLNGGTLNIDTGGGLLGLASPLTISDGTLNATNDLIVRQLNWEGGTITGSGKLTTPAIGNATLSTGNTKYLQNKTWDNAGTININGGRLQLSGYGSDSLSAAAPTLNNLAGGTINLNSTDYSPIYGYSYLSGQPTLNNAGTLNWNSSYSDYGYSNIYNTAFNNSGVVNVNAGLRLDNSSGADTGSYQIAPQKELGFYYSNRNISGAAAFGGSGTIYIGYASTLDFANSLSIANPVSLDSGSITGAGDLTLTNLDWTQGVISGTGKLITPAGGVARLSVNTNKLLQNRTWENAGTIDINEGTLLLSDAGSGSLAAPTLSNLSNGIINVNSTNYTPIYGSGGSGSSTPTLNNAGTINWNAVYSNYGYSAIASTIVNNAGTIFVNESLHFDSAPGSDTGTYQIAAGKHLGFYYSNHNLSGDAQFTGTGGIQIYSGTTLAVNGNKTLISIGSIELSGGNLTIASPAANQTLSGSLTLNGGTLDATDDLSVSQLNWNSGTITGSGKLLTTGSSILDTDGGKYFLNKIWDNSGTIDIKGGALEMYSYGSSSTQPAPAATLNNLAGGIINVSAFNYNPIHGSNSNSEQTTLNNAGTLNWNGQYSDGNSSIYNITLNNSGTINATTGLSLVYGNGSSTGTFNIADGQSLVLVSSTQSLSETASIIGKGTVEVQWGSALNIANNLSISNLLLSGGEVLADGDLTLSNLNWNSGVIGGSGKLTTPSGSTTNLDTSDTKYLRNKTWDNAGTINVLAGSLVLYDNSYDLPAGTVIPAPVLNNLAGGIINVSASEAQPIYGSYNLNTPAFNNAGTLNWNAIGAGDSNSSLYSLEFNNSGTVNVNESLWIGNSNGNDSGLYQVANGKRLSFYYGDRTVSGNIAGSGELTVDYGNTLTLSGKFDLAASGPITINYGTLNLDTSGSSLNLAKPLTINNGTLNAVDDLEVQNLAWSGGTITGPGKLFTGAGSTTTLDGATTKYLLNKTWDNAGTINIADGSLKLYGNGSIDLPAATPTLNNLADGTITITTTSNYPIYSHANYSEPGVLNNNGTIDWQVNGSQGSARAGRLAAASASGNWGEIYGVTFNNNNQLLISGGTASISGTFVQQGTLDIAAGAVFENIYGFTNTGIITGQGTIDVSAGTLINTGTLSPGGNGTTGTLSILGKLDLTGGTVALDLGGTCNCQSDQLVVTGDITLGGNVQGNLVNGYVPFFADYIPVITTTGTASGSFASSTLPNSFTAGYNLSSGEAVRLIYGGGSSNDKVFTNTAGGLNWDNPGNWSGGTLPASNSNVLISSSGQAYAVTHASGDDHIAALTISNSNSLEISGGSLKVSGSTNLDGALIISGSGQATLGGELIGGVSGQVSVTGGSLTLNTNSAIKHLTLTGGTLGGSGSLTIGDMTWASHLIGNGAVNVHGVLSINPGAARSSGEFNNYGTATLADTYFGVPLSDGAVFNNYGTLNINTNAEFWQGSSIGTPFSGDFSTGNFFANSAFTSGSGARFVNQSGGIVNRNDYAYGSIFYGLAFDNFGTINMGAGYLSLRAGGNLAGSINQNAGTTGGIYLESGDFSLSGTLGSNTRLNLVGSVSANIAGDMNLETGAILDRSGGTLGWTGGKVWLASDAFLKTGGANLEVPLGGTLSGTGTIDLGSGTLSNLGTLSPGCSGAVGTFHVTGNLSLGSSSTLLMDLGGPAASDLLEVSGNLAVNGQLVGQMMPGYTPQEFDATPVLTMGGSASGNFSSLSLPGNFVASYGRASGEWTRLIYSSTDANVFTNTIGNNAWEESQNWLFGLPQDTHKVVISGSNNVVHGSGTDTIATLTIDSGNSLAINGGSLSVAGLTNLAGSLLVSGSGQATLGGELIAGASGKVSVSGGSLILNTDSAIKQLQLTGGMLGGSANLAIGDMTWASHLVGKGSVYVQGALEINPGAARSSGQFNNYGTATMASSYFGVPLSDGAIFNNYGTLNINSNAEFWQGTSTGTPFSGSFDAGNYFANSAFSNASGARFVNQNIGIVNRNDYASSSIFYGLVFDSFGTINMGAGSLGLRAGGNLAGSIKQNSGTTGAIYLEGGNFALSGKLGSNTYLGMVDALGTGVSALITGDMNLEQGAMLERSSGTLGWTVGDLTLASGAFLKTGGTNLTIPAGSTLAGTGTVDVGNGTLNNLGILSPGGSATVGTLKVAGNLDLGSSSALLMDLGGPTASDRLDVSGNLAVNGQLLGQMMPGHTPQEFDATPVLTMGGSASGNFSSLSLPGNFVASYGRASGEWTRLIYSSTDANVFTNTIGNNAWEESQNWLFGLPQDTHKVLISGSSNVVHGSGTDTIATLTIDSGNSLAISGGSLSVAGLTNLAGSLLVSGSGQATLGGELIAGASGKVSVSGGSLVLHTNSAIKQLQLTGGMLGGSANLTIGDMTWGSHLTGTGVVSVQGTLDIQPGAARSSGQFNNYGTATMASSDFGVPLSDGAVFNNYGTLNINSNAEFWQGTSTGTPFSSSFDVVNHFANSLFSGASGARFVNQASGIFNRNDYADGSTFYNLAFDNFGTINIGAGYLGLQTGGTLAGNIFQNPGTSGFIALTGGSFKFSGRLGSNTWIRLVNSGAAQIAGDLVLDSNAVLDGSSDLGWSSGKLSLATGAVLNTHGSDLAIPAGSALAGSGTVDLGGATLHNAGTLSPGGNGSVGSLHILGNLTLAGSSVLQLDLGGPAASDLLDVSGNLAVNGQLVGQMMPGYTPQEFDATPVLTMGGSASGNFSSLSLPGNFVASYGRASGEWTRLIYSSTDANVFTNTIGNNAWEDSQNWLFGLPQDTHKVVISGSNNVVHGSGTDTIATLSIDSGNSLAINGGSLSILGDTQVAGALSTSGNGILKLGSSSTIRQLTLASDLLFANGTATIRNLSAPGLSVTGGSLTLGVSAGDTSSLSGGLLSVSGGSLTLGGGTLSAGSASIVTPGIVNYQGGQLIGLNLLSNTGTLNLANATINFPISNTGNIGLNGGVTFAQRFTNEGGTLSVAGTNIFQSGLLQNAGTILLNNGQITGNVTINGGVLGGNGTIIGKLSVGTASLSPGFSPGALTINGDLSLSPGSVLNMEIGGTTPGGTYDQLRVSGVLSLDGTLNVSTYGDYAPTTDSKHDILTFGSSTGSFNKQNLPDGLKTVAGNSVLQVVPISIIEPPEPEPVINSPSVLLASNSIISSLQSVVGRDDGSLSVGLASPAEKARDDKKSEETLPACP